MVGRRDAHPVHKKPIPLIPKGFLEQVEEEDGRGNQLTHPEKSGVVVVVVSDESCMSVKYGIC